MNSHLYWTRLSNDDEVLDRTSRCSSRPHASTALVRSGNDSPDGTSDRSSHDGSGAQFDGSQSASGRRATTESGKRRRANGTAAIA